MPYTYDSLTADIVANMEEDSSEFLAALPTIVVRAQDYLQRRIDTPNILRMADVTVSASTRTIDLPSDLLVLKAVQLSTNVGTLNLIQQTNEYLTSYWPVYTSVGTPKYYAAKDNLQIFVAPTPEVNSSALVEYVPRVTVLTSAQPSNWFSDNAEAAFFAACMMFANAWTKNPGAVQLWKGQTDEELAVLNNEARRSRRSDISDRNAGPPENNLAPNQS